MDYGTTKEEGENKKFISKITIEGINGENTLGGKILANNEVIEKEPDFSVGFPNANTSEEESKKLSGLYKTEDDEGTSYYFRGAVENNYVNFADMLWRIVRINGDGTIRLILNEGSHDSSYNAFNNTLNINNRKYVGFTYDNNIHQCTKTDPCEVTYDLSSNSFNNKFGGTNSTIKDDLENWYKENLKDVNEKISSGFFCNDTSYGSGEDNEVGILNYGGEVRLYENYSPSLKCLNPNNSSGQPRTYGGIYKTKIGLITADELAFSGQSIWGKNQNIIGKNKEQDLKTLGDSYLAINDSYLTRDTWYWSMTPYRDDNSISNAIVWGTHIWYSSSNLIPGIVGIYNAFGIGAGINKTVVPVINLKSSVQATGEGTKENPFVMN